LSLTITDTCGNEVTATILTAGQKWGDLTITYTCPGSGYNVAYIDIGSRQWTVYWQGPPSTCRHGVSDCNTNCPCYANWVANGLDGVSVTSGDDYGTISCIYTVEKQYHTIHTPPTEEIHVATLGYRDWECA